jgi:hypothetical protein
MEPTYHVPAGQTQVLSEELTVENLQTQDPHAIGVFRVNHSTTASVNDAGEVTIRQVRKQAVAPSRDPDLRAIDNALAGTSAARVQVEIVEVVVKLAALDFVKIARMVGALHVEEH